MTSPSPVDLDADLRYAAGRGQITPRFAPLARPGDGVVAGFAVHTTWAHPTLGPLGPNWILPRAVRLGLAARLDRWTLEQTCEHVARWGSEALDALSLVVVSCSEAGSRDPYIVPLARAAADLAGVPADRLVLAWPARALTDELIATHHRLGVGVGGTGLSSLGDPRLDAAVLGAGSVRRVLDDDALQRETQSASRRGVRVLARIPTAPTDLATLAEAGVTLVEGDPALSASDACTALTGSGVPAA